MRHLRRAAILPAAIVATWGCGDGNGDGSPTDADDEDATPVGETAALVDPALEAPIRSALERSGEELTIDGLLSLTQLEAQDKGISGLKSRTAGLLW